MTTLNYQLMASEVGEAMAPSAKKATTSLKDRAISHSLLHSKVLSGLLGAFPSALSGGGGAAPLLRSRTLIKCHDVIDCRDIDRMRLFRVKFIMGYCGLRLCCPRYRDIDSCTG